MCCTVILIARREGIGDLLAEAYSGLLGKDVTGEELWGVCSEVSQAERDFNLPDCFLNHAIPDGPSKGTTIDIRRLVRDYYKEKGWED